MQQTRPQTTRSQTTRPWAAVAAATVLTLPLGTIYAFSVFIGPIEADLGISRSALSFVFGLATVGYIFGMNLAPLVFGRVSPALLTALCGLVGGGGILLAATAHGLPQLLFGYSVLFGGAGGAAYIVLQQAAMLLVETNRGLLNGYVLSLYPGGAMIAAPLFGWSNTVLGWRTTLMLLAATLVGCGLSAAALTWWAGSFLPHRATAERTSRAAWRTKLLLRMCLLFFLAAAAGLTVLSQAVGIITAYGGAAGTALGAATGITAVIAASRLGGGWLVDRIPVPFVGALAHGIALSGTALLTLLPGPVTAVPALALIGMGYGLISGCTAGGISVYWKPALFGRVAGRIYIAWCVAAVTLPVLAGHLYDLTHGYETAILIAGCGNLLGIVVALGLPSSRDRVA